MVFEKYRARKAYIKELKSYSLSELEREHQKLRNPHPPSYDDLYKDTLSGGSQAASPHSLERPHSYSRSSSNASSQR